MPNRKWTTTRMQKVAGMQSSDKEKSLIEKSLIEDIY